MPRPTDASPSFVFRSFRAVLIPRWLRRWFVWWVAVAGATWVMAACHGAWSLIAVGSVIVALATTLPAMVNEGVEAFGDHRHHKAVDGAVRAVQAVAMIVAIAQWVGGLAGHTDPVQPLRNEETLAVPKGGAKGAATAKFQRGDALEKGVAFQAVRTTNDLDMALSQHRPTVLDFYADWCVACREMERETFPDAHVQQTLMGFQRLRADVTHNTLADQALLKRFGLFGPPGLLVFDDHGNVRATVVGYEPPHRFVEHLTLPTSDASSIPSLGTGARTNR